MYSRREVIKMAKILVCDDDREIVEAIEIYLSQEGYQILKAYDGIEALEILEKEEVNLLIIDVMMPRLDGIRATLKIREKNSLPIIILSAKSEDTDKILGLNIGADDYVTKPFNMTILVLRIRKLIELSRYHRVTQGMIDPAPSEIVITSLDEKLIEKAIKYVEDNMSRTELSVEELSRELGMSRVHLYKKLLQITGKTPIEFIRVIRLKRAAQLLRESQLHVSEVAFEVGFNNPKYFSRYFKDEFGVLPSVYQEKEGK